MKYLVLIVLVAGGYWSYQNGYIIDESNMTISEAISKVGHVKASRVLAETSKMVDSICADEQVLRQWGSSSSACFERVSKFKDMCTRRILPNLEANIVSDEQAKALMSRYSKCVLPG